MIKKLLQKKIQTLQKLNSHLFTTRLLDTENLNRSKKNIQHLCANWKHTCQSDSFVRLFTAQTRAGADPRENLTESVKGAFKTYTWNMYFTCTWSTCLLPEQRDLHCEFLMDKIPHLDRNLHIREFRVLCREF